MWTRTVPAGLLIACFGYLAPIVDVAAEPAHKVRRSTPAHTSRTAPDVTATVAKPPPAPKPLPVAPADDEIPPPFTLPAASRTTMRACGATWRDMKLAGRTGDDDWREFAMKCLVAK